jgi:hypothetical protein
VEDQGRPDRDRPHHLDRRDAGSVQARRELNLLSHCVSAACAAPARTAYEFLCDGSEVGRWALGAFNARRVGTNLYRGTSLFDGQTLLFRPVGDRARLVIDYHVGTSAAKLVPRAMARVMPGATLGRARNTCVVSLLAWREASMPDERWARLVACHEVEILLIQSLLEKSSERKSGKGTTN